MTATIYQKLSTASRSMGTLIKSSANSYEGYLYVSSDDVVFHARKALTEAGLAFFEVSSSIGRLDADPAVVYMRTCYVLADTETGDLIEMQSDVPIHREKKNVQLDKQSAASRTYSLAYALRGLLLADRVEKPRPLDEEEPDARKPDAPAKEETDEKTVLWNRLKALRAEKPKAAKGLPLPKSIEELKEQIAKIEASDDL